MSVLNIDRHSSYRSRRKAEAREYWLIFCILYPFLLVAALFGRIAALVQGGGRAAGEGRRPSIFAEARTAAASSIPFAFK